MAKIRRDENIKKKNARLFGPWISKYLIECALKLEFIISQENSQMHFHIPIVKRFHPKFFNTSVF